MSHSRNESTEAGKKQSSRRAAALDNQRESELLPWADPYIASLFDEHRRQSPRRTGREEFAENFSAWFSCM